MDVKLHPGDWYTGQAFCLTVGEIHEHYARQIHQKGTLLPKLCVSGDTVMLQTIPQEAYSVQQHIRAALKSLLVLAADEETVYQMVQGYEGGNISDFQERYFAVAEERIGPISQFAKKYGPLIHDFADFCRPLRNQSPLFAFTYGDTMTRVGMEHKLFGEEWEGYCVGLRSAGLVSSNVSPLLPAPVGLYLWAADMLTALKKFPEEPGCQLFLTNRLMSLRLVPASSWSTGKSLFQIGELLDYLALHAAYGLVNVAEGEYVPCRGCGIVFYRLQGRIYYCEKCRENKSDYDMIRARVSRQRRKARE